MHELHLLAILLLTISSNADNVVVGIAFGVRGTRVPLASNLLIAAISATGTLLSMLAGKTMAGFVQSQLAAWIGGLMIIGAGVWVLIQEAKLLHLAGPSTAQSKAERKASSEETLFRRAVMLLDNPCAADRDSSGHISLKESFPLGLAVTLNNLVYGLAAGLMGLSPALTTCFVIIFSIFSLWLGLRAGCSLGHRWLGRLAGPVSGLLLIFVGIYEIFF